MASMFSFLTSGDRKALNRWYDYWTKCCFSSPPFRHEACRDPWWWEDQEWAWEAWGWAWPFRRWPPTLMQRSGQQRRRLTPEWARRPCSCSGAWEASTPEWATTHSPWVTILLLLDRQRGATNSKSVASHVQRKTTDPSVHCLFICCNKVLVAVFSLFRPAKVVSRLAVVIKWTGIFPHDNQLCLTGWFWPRAPVWQNDRSWYEKEVGIKAAKTKQDVTGKISETEPLLATSKAAFA